MHTPFVALTFLAVSTMAQKLAFTNTASFGAMLKRGDAIIKRQGYTPDTTSCGTGDTCEEACGVGQVECPSSSAFTLYCHDSTDGSVRSVQESINDHPLTYLGMLSRWIW
jgi:hypothetical protein